MLEVLTDRLSRATNSDEIVRTIQQIKSQGFTQQIDDIHDLLNIMQTDHLSDDALEEIVDLLEAIAEGKKTGIHDQFDQPRVDFLLEMLGMKSNYVSFAILNILKAAQLYKQIESSSEGVAKLLDCMVSHEEIRKEVVQLLICVSSASADVKKTIAFNEGFDKIFETVTADGGPSAPNENVPDLLLLCYNVLAGCDTAQRLFMENQRWIFYLREFFDVESLAQRSNALEDSTPRLSVQDLVNAIQTLNDSETRVSCLNIALKIITCLVEAPPKASLLPHTTNIPDMERRRVVTALDELEKRRAKLCGMVVGCVATLCMHTRELPFSCALSSLQMLEAIASSPQGLSSQVPHLLSEILVRGFKSQEDDNEEVSDISGLSFAWTLARYDTQWIPLPMLLVDRYVCGFGSAEPRLAERTQNDNLPSLPLDHLSQLCLSTFDAFLNEPISCFVLQNIKTPMGPLVEYVETYAGDVLEPSLLEDSVWGKLLSGIDLCVHTVTANNLSSSPRSPRRATVPMLNYPARAVERAGNILTSIFTRGGEIARELIYNTNIQVLALSPNTNQASLFPNSGTTLPAPKQSMNLVIALLRWAEGMGRIAVNEQVSTGAAAWFACAALLRAVASACSNSKKISSRVLSDPSANFVLNLCHVPGPPIAGQFAACLVVGEALTALGGDDDEAKLILGMIDKKMGVTAFLDVFQKAHTQSEKHTSREDSWDRTFVSASFREFYRDHYELVRRSLFTMFGSVGASEYDERSREAIALLSSRVKELEERNKELESTTGCELLSNNHSTLHRHTEDAGLAVGDVKQMEEQLTSQTAEILRLKETIIAERSENKSLRDEVEKKNRMMELLHSEYEDGYVKRDEHERYKFDTSRKIKLLELQIQQSSAIPQTRVLDENKNLAEGDENPAIYMHDLEEIVKQLEFELQSKETELQARDKELEGVRSSIHSDLNRSMEELEKRFGEEYTKCIEYFQEFEEDVLETVVQITPWSYESPPSLKFECVVERFEVIVQSFRNCKAERRSNDEVIESLSKQVQEDERAIADLQMSLDESDAKVEQLDEAKHAVELELQSLQAEIEDLRNSERFVDQERIELSKKLDTLQEQNQELQLEVNDRDAVIDKINKEKLEAVLERQNAVKFCDSLSNELSGKNQTIQNLEEALDSLNSFKFSFEEEKRGLEDVLCALKQENCRLQNEPIILKEEIQRLTDELEDLRRSKVILDQSEQSDATIQSQLLEENKKLNDERINLLQTVQSLQNEKQALHDQLSADMQSWKQSFRDAEGVSQELKQLKEFQEQRDNEMDLLILENETLTQEYTARNEQLVLAIEEKDKLIAKVNQLEDQLEQRNRETDVLTSENTVLIQQCSSKSELEQLTAEDVELKKAIPALIAKHNVEFEELRKTMRHLEDDNDQSATEVNRIKSVLQQRNVEVDKLKKSMQSMLDEHDANLEALRERLQKKESEHEDDRRALVIELNRREASVQKLTAEIDELRQTLQLQLEKAESLKLVYDERPFEEQGMGLGELQELLQTRENELAMVNIDLEKSREELRAVKETIGCTRCTKLTGDVEFLNRQLGEFRGQAEEVSELRANLKALLGQNQALDESLTQAKSVALQSQLDAAASTESLEIQVQQLKGENEALMSRVKSLESERETLQAANQVLNNRMDELDAQTVSSAGEALSATGENAQASQKIATLKKTEKDLRKCLEELVAEVASKEQHKKMLQDEVDLFKREVEYYRSQVSLVTEGNVSRRNDELSEEKARNDESSGLNDTDRVASALLQLQSTTLSNWSELEDDSRNEGGNQDETADEEFAVKTDEWHDGGDGKADDWELEEGPGEQVDETPQSDEWGWEEELADEQETDLIKALNSKVFSLEENLAEEQDRVARLNEYLAQERETNDQLRELLEATQGAPMDADELEQIRTQNDELREVVKQYTDNYEDLFIELQRTKKEYEEAQQANRMMGEIEGHMQLLADLREQCDQFAKRAESEREFRLNMQYDYEQLIAQINADGVAEEFIEDKQRSHEGDEDFMVDGGQGHEGDEEFMEDREQDNEGYREESVGYEDGECAANREQGNEDDGEEFLENVEQVDELRRQLEEKENENEHLRQQTADCERNFATLYNYEEKLLNDLEQSKQSNEMLEEQIRKLQRNPSSQQDLHLLEEQLEQLRGQLEETENENENLREQVVEWRHKYEDLYNYEEKLLNDLDLSKQSNDVFQEQIQTLHEQLQTLKEERSLHLELRELIGALKDEKELPLETQRATSPMKVMVCRPYLKAMSEHRMLRRELDELQKDHENVLQMCAQMNCELQVFSGELLRKCGQRQYVSTRAMAKAQVMKEFDEYVELDWEHDPPVDTHTSQVSSTTAANTTNTQTHIRTSTSQDVAPSHEAPRAVDPNPNPNPNPSGSLGLSPNVTLRSRKRDSRRGGAQGV